MLTSSVAGLPDDDDALAAIAADGSQPETTRRDAFERLLPSVELVARRLSCRFTGQCRNDILTDAAGDIWEVLSSFPSGGVRFEGWCYVVLRNKWFDEVTGDGRRRAREIKASEAAVKDSDIRSAIEGALDARDGIGAQDISLISGWPCRDRLVLLSISGLWQKVPGDAWVCWVREHIDRFGVPEDERFPPSALAECDDLADRNAILAVALNLKRNTLSVVLYRGKFRLLELRYVRDRI